MEESSVVDFLHILWSGSEEVNRRENTLWISRGENHKTRDKVELSLLG
jgi:hypothetical protein